MITRCRLSKRHARLAAAGDECNHIFMILSGEVEMTSTSPNFSSLHKKVWVDGAVFGELHMLNLGKCTLAPCAGDLVRSDF